jgi:hypothetical protein
MIAEIVLEVPESLGEYLRDELAEPDVEIVTRTASRESATLELGPGEAALLLTIAVNAIRLGEYGVKLGERINQWRANRELKRARIVIRGRDDDEVVTVEGNQDIERVGEAVERSASERRG